MSERTAGPDRLARLKRLASEATPGPWRACGDSGTTSCACRQVWSTSADVLVSVAMSEGDEAYTGGEGVPHSAACACARFIAAADPSTVLGLLAEREAMIARIRELESRQRGPIDTPAHHRSMAERWRELAGDGWSAEQVERLASAFERRALELEEQARGNV